MAPDERCSRVLSGAPRRSSFRMDGLLDPEDGAHVSVCDAAMESIAPLEFALSDSPIPGGR